MAGITISAVLLASALSGAGADPPAVAPFEDPVEPTPRCRIDELVFARLAELGIRPARPCSDAVFVRRVHLDVIGTLPAPAEVRRFLEDRDLEKRSALVDRLLEREEFADYWAMKWGDLLRVKAEFPINLWPNAAQAYHRWIRTAIRDGLPYDRFARELLASNGSNFRVPQVNFYRAVQSRTPEALAAAVALTFLGARIDKWPEDRKSGMAAFFSRIGYKETGEWKEEIVSFDPEAGGAASAAPRPAVLPDGTPVLLQPERDPRAVFADWLVSPGNPWFARAMANRLWSWLLGRGLIHEPDDIRPDNPARHPDVVAWLEGELVASRYDLKRLYRAILNSATYGLSPIPRSAHPDAEACFAFYPVRRLDAEVLIDALNAVTGTTEKYSSAIPEPFTFIPEGQRSIALPDGSIGSAFLEMFGRPPRDTGLESERNNRPSAAGSLHLLNSSHIGRKIQAGLRIRASIGSGKKPREVARDLYLLILSRLPTEGEIAVAEEYARSHSGGVREAALDLAWALLNGSEFLFRH
jgi:hypothetical protein